MNPDCMPIDDLKALTLKLKRITVTLCRYRRKKPDTYANMKNLQRCVLNTYIARSCRLDGAIHQALSHEAWADTYYEKLPIGMKW